MTAMWTGASGRNDNERSGPSVFDRFRLIQTDQLQDHDDHHDRTDDINNGVHKLVRL